MNFTKSIIVGIACFIGFFLVSHLFVSYFYAIAQSVAYCDALKEVILSVDFQSWTIFLGLILSVIAGINFFNTQED